MIKKKKIASDSCFQWPETELIKNDEGRENKKKCQLLAKSLQYQQQVQAH